MQFSVLGSGSKGNSTYVESGGTAILIDAGFSGIETKRRLESIGIDISTISAILITHEHGDHVKGAGILSRKYNIPILANKKTKTASGKHLEKLHAFQEFTTGTSFQFQDLTIHPFRVNHDTVDPVGFTLSDPNSTLGYCTDTGMVSRLIQHRLSLCNGLILECNHDLDMLKNGPYPVSLQQRIRSKNGHLANNDSMKFLQGLIHEQLSHIVLAHISESNNCHNIVQNSVKQLLHSLNVANKPTITLAMQDSAGSLVTI